jgi:hypothetical protein
MQKEGRHIMPRNIAFKDVPEGALFLCENGESDLVLYRKLREYGLPYGCWTNRHGGPLFYPAKGQEQPVFFPDQLVYRLASEKDG